VTDERARRDVRRDQKTLDQNARIAAWLNSNSWRGLSQRQLAAKATANLGFNVSQSRVSRVANMGIQRAA
jgi:hypothetical protein